MDKLVRCDGCQALWYCYSVPCGCLLNFKNTKQDGEYVPLEPCPKPLTEKEFKALKHKGEKADG